MCGKSTYHTEYDYLVTPRLHLGCYLDDQMKHPLEKAVEEVLSEDNNEQQ